MILAEEHRLGTDRILTCVIPQYQEWVPSILKELEQGSDQFKYLASNWWSLGKFLFRS